WIHVRPNQRDHRTEQEQDPAGGLQAEEGLKRANHDPDQPHSCAIRGHQNDPASAASEQRGKWVFSRLALTFGTGILRPASRSARWRPDHPGSCSEPAAPLEIMLGRTMPRKAEDGQDKKRGRQIQVNPPNILKLLDEGVVRGSFVGRMSRMVERGSERNGFASVLRSTKSVSRAPGSKASNHLTGDGAASGVSSAAMPMCSSPSMEVKPPPA